MNTWGKNIRLSIFGESHGECVGITIDGLPHGIYLDEKFIDDYLQRRRASDEVFSTKRTEADIPKIISGVLENITTGAPLTAIFENKNIYSTSYDNFKKIPRPSHSDYPAFIKFMGFNDIRGGGHFSGRLTAPICFAGAISSLILETYKINCISHIASIGKNNDDRLNPTFFDKNLKNKLKNDRFPFINQDVKDKSLTAIKEAFVNKNSIGGTIECGIYNVPCGIGEPFFSSIESHLSSLLFSIPAVKAVEFGDGFEISKLLGSEANDKYFLENNVIKTTTNHNGGILAGISNSMPIIVRVGIKPTASISSKQNTLNIDDLTMQTLEIKGRHDPCIVPRAVVCIESACAIAILDLILENEKYARKI